MTCHDTLSIFYSCDVTPPTPVSLSHPGVHFDFTVIEKWADERACFVNSDTQFATFDDLRLDGSVLLLPSFASSLNLSWRRRDNTGPWLSLSLSHSDTLTLNFTFDPLLDWRDILNRSFFCGSGWGAVRASAFLTVADVRVSWATFAPLPSWSSALPPSESAFTWQTRLKFEAQVVVCLSLKKQTLLVQSLNSLLLSKIPGEVVEFQTFEQKQDNEVHRYYLQRFELGGGKE